MGTSPELMFRMWICIWSAQPKSSSWQNIHLPIDQKADLVSISYQCNCKTSTISFVFKKNAKISETTNPNNLYQLHDSDIHVTSIKILHNKCNNLNNANQENKMPSHPSNQWNPNKKTEIKFPTKGKQILPENLAAYSAYSCTQENSSGNPHYPFQLPAVNTDYIKQ